MKSLVRLTIGGCCSFCGICIYKGDQKFYKEYLMPVIHFLDPEQAHRLAIWASKYRLLPKSSYEDPDVLVMTTKLVKYELKTKESKLSFY